LKKYLIKRLIGLVPVFIGITFISFLVIHLAPGGPVDTRAELNPKMTAQAKEKLCRLYDLDKPLAVQYGIWVKRVIRFDFGNSFTDGQSVASKIASAAAVTLGINSLAFLLIFLVGVPLGVFGAVRKGSFGDHCVTSLALFGFSIPRFFGVYLRVLPVLGLHSLFFDRMGPLAKLADLSRHLILPLFVSAFTGIAGISRYARRSMDEALRQSYVRTARAKGLPESAVIYRHALRNALLPIITIAGLSIPGLLGGSVIFETIFSIPGMGRLFFNSVFSRDYPVIMAMLVLGAFLTLIGNLIADMGYALADPRVRAGYQS
jgi:peptide/nickel transport system permease protein